MPVVYTFCERCKAYIAIEIKPDVIERHNVFPFPYSYVHGNPAHILTIYLDQDLVERGHEVSEIHEGAAESVNPQVASAPAPPTTAAKPMLTPPPKAVPTLPRTPVGTKSKRIVPRVIAEFDRKRLSVVEFKLLSLIDGKITLREIADKLGLQFFAAMRMLLDLQKQGLVTFEKRV